MKTMMIHLKRGFTIVELTVVMMMGMMTGTMILAIFNQQLAFLKVYQAQSFLSEEAPMVNMYVSRVVGKADRFRLHDTITDALSGNNPRTTASPVCLLNFRQPDGTMRATIFSFDDLGDGPALYYYVVPVSGALGNPQWSVTRRPSNVEFLMEQGILRTKLTGPNGEQIIYSGTMQ